MNSIKRRDFFRLARPAVSYCREPVHLYLLKVKSQIPRNSIIADTNARMTVKCTWQAKATMKH